MRNSEFLPNIEIRSLSNFAKLTAYTVPILMLLASILAFEKTSDPLVIQGFVLKETHEFPSMNFAVYLYEHYRFNCPFLYVSAKDPHNFFATTFRTASSDDSGALNVIEHLITHSSEKYPVKNLFQELKKGSFATLLTSYSSNEWTAFPFSTTNSNDFHNIIDAYFDAIFHPLINNATFYSECHRLEFEEPFDHSTPLHHDGTVYNEIHDESLKPNSQFTNLLHENLYPNSILKNNYHGTPSQISKLTISTLKNRHAKYYHPSNALFFYYGSFPIKELLAHISSAISSFQTSSSPIKENMYDQPKWTVPHSGVFDGQLDENTPPERVRASLSWMCGDLRNISDIVDLEFLSILLTYSSVSPLYRGLLKPEFGTRFLHTGYFPVVRNPYFSIGLEGFNPTFMKFNQTVFALLKQLYQNGFDSNRVKSLLNRHEMHQKYISASQGLKLWRSIIGSWIHNISPFEVIDPSWEIERLKKLLSVQPRYFEMIMKQQLIDNNHLLDLTIRGLPDFNEDLIRNEKVDLRYLKENITLEEKEGIVDIAKLVKSYREEQKPLHLLPLIRVEDIKSEHHIKPQPIDFGDFVLYNANLNGIVNVEIKANIPLDSEYIEDIPLLEAVLAEVGAGVLDEDQFSTQEQLYTSGFKCQFAIKPSSKEKESGKCNVEGLFIIKCSALSKNIEHLFSLLEMMLLSPHLDNSDQIAVLISMLAANLEQKSFLNSNEYVSRYAAAGLSQAAALEELLSGFTSIKRISTLAHRNDWSAVSVRIQKVYRHVFRMGHFTALLHCSESDNEETIELADDLLSKLNNHTNKQQSGNKIEEFYSQVALKNKIFVASDTFHYCTSVSIKGPFFKPNSTQFAAFSVATEIVQSEILYPFLTEKNGIAKIESNYNHIYGIAMFSTTKDKNPPKTIQIIEDSFSHLITDELSQDMIDRAIIRLVSKLDQPVSPSELGAEMFLYNITQEQANFHRESILNVTRDDVIKVAKIMNVSPKRYVIYGTNQDAMVPQGFESLDIRIDELAIL